MKKIMFVCNTLGGGGAERVVSVLTNTLLQKDYQVYILVHKKASKEYDFDRRINVLFSSKDGSASKYKRVTAIRRAVKENQIDSVIAFSHYNAMYAVIACIGLEVRVIGSERNDPAQLDNRKVLKTLRLILYKHLDCLVCQTEDAKKYFPKEIQERSTIILNPLTDSLPEPYTGRRERRVVSFSRFDLQKNIPMLIDAFEIFHREFCDYKLDLYGDGSEKDRIKAYVKKKDMDGCVKIHPFVNNIHERIEDASIFALASNYEGLSNSMIEALALGIPSVVTDCPCGGARMVINNYKNGVLVPVGDVNAMAKAMKNIASDSELAKKMSEEAVNIRNKLSAKKIANEWMEIIEGGIA